MKNFKQEGKTISFANTGTAIASGDVVIQGKIIGVAVTDIAATTGVGAVAIRGVFELALVASLAITAGDEVFWDSTNKVVTKTATDTPLGVAVTTQAANDATVDVLINVGAVGSMAVAATVAALTGTLTGTVNGALVDVAATAASTSGGSTPTAAQVDTGIATAVASIVTGVNEQNKEFETKINAILTALKNAGHMA